MRLCKKLLKHPADFVERVVLTDEMFFIFHQKLSLENHGTWCQEHPHDFCETQIRKGENVLQPSVMAGFRFFIHSLTLMILLY